MNFLVSFPMEVLKIKLPMEWYRHHAVLWGGTNQYCVSATVREIFVWLAHV